MTKGTFYIFLFTILVVAFLSFETVFSFGSTRLLTDDELEKGEFENALESAVEYFNKKQYSKSYYSPYDVHNVTAQLVSGILLKFNMTLVPTRCSRDTLIHTKLFHCSIKDTSEAQHCEFSVHMQPWLQNDKPYAVEMKSCVAKHSLALHEKLWLLGIDEEDDHEENFETFKTKHGIQYSNGNEENFRFGVFKSNMRKAQVMQLLDLGSAQYGMTPFSDLTEEEFRKTKLSPLWDITKAPKRMARMDELSKDLPDAYDWRDHGAVTPVKNQGSCGSCWAFSTTGNVEGQWFVKTGKLLSLSEQELVDCDKLDEGCNGGLPSNAYKAIMNIGGLETEEDYPYKGRNNKCQFNPSESAVFVNDSLSISQDEKEMAAWLVTHGPISIGINANMMQFYMGGVAHPWSFLCSKKQLNHGVLIVGYGVATQGGNKPYWIVKNSWGPSWGSKGYYYVYRGDGTCGLNTMCTSAVID